MEFSSASALHTGPAPLHKSGTWPEFMDMDDEALKKSAFQQELLSAEQARTNAQRVQEPSCKLTACSDCDRVSPKRGHESLKIPEPEDGLAAPASLEYISEEKHP